LRREVEDLLVKGVFEIVLIAQDLASFGLDRGSPGELIPLLEELSAVPGDFWLRLLYIHPDNFPFELLDLCGKDRRILPYFDLPFQHASARILGRMNRRGDSETYLSLIDTIRSELPNSAIRSTFLLGFPGEAEGDFRELADFIEEAELDWAGFFTYSREEGTAAFRYRGPLGDLLSRRAASRRLGALQGIQEEITKKRMDRFIGHTMDILIEEEIREEGVSIGRGYIHAPDVDGAVVVKGAFPPGTVVPCRIDARNGIDLEASPLDPFARKGNP
jgi:ribosomal protein S12 methylthiotransferase